MTKAKQQAVSDDTAIAYHYVGGFYIHGVPARDLTLDEARQYAEVITQQQLLTGLTLYQRSEVTEVAPADAEPAEE
jgi:hypothetical protein